MTTTTAKPVAPSPQRNPHAGVGLGLAIASVALCITGPLGLILATAGVAVAFIGLRRSRENRNHGATRAVAALFIGGAGFLLSAGQTAILGAGFFGVRAVTHEFAAFGADLDAEARARGYTDFKDWSAKDPDGSFAIMQSRTNQSMEKIQRLTGADMPIFLDGGLAVRLADGGIADPRAVKSEQDYLEAPIGTQGALE